MSSKGTIFLTKDNEHCYEETNIKDGNKFRVVLEISKDNIMDFYEDESDMIIDIKGDSQLARYLRFAGIREEYNGLL